MTLPKTMLTICILWWVLRYFVWTTHGLGDIVPIELLSSLIIGIIFSVCIYKNKANYKNKGIYYITQLLSISLAIELPLFLLLVFFAVKFFGA